MMGNNRNFILLVVALVVLGGLYLLGRNNRSNLDTTGGFVDVVEGTLSTDDVYAIEASIGGDAEQGLQMVRRGQDWFMPNHFDAPVNLNKVRTLLGNLEALEGEMRSKDASVLDAYALDDSSAYWIVVRDESGGALVELLVGKRSGGGCFVRQAGSDEVLLGNHNFLSDFAVWGDERNPPDRKAWVELVAFEVERADVRRIEIRGEQRVVMEKEFAAPAVAEGDSVATPPGPDDYEWRVTQPENFLAVRTKAEAVLNGVASLRARDAVARGEAPAEYGLGDEATRLVVGMEDGTSHVLLLGADLADDAFALRVEGEDLVWSVPKYLRTNLVKGADDLRE